MISRTGRPSSDKVPRFDQLAVETVATVCGQEGTLQLRFVNDRLETTLYTPSEFESCRALLINSGLNLQGTEVGFRISWITTDADGRRSIGVGDARLRREVDEWIRRYAVLSPAFVRTGTRS